jgi:hypothetical protein
MIDYAGFGYIILCFLRRMLAFGLRHEMGCVLHDRDWILVAILSRL